MGGCFSNDTVKEGLKIVKNFTYPEYIGKFADKNHDGAERRVLDDPTSSDPAFLQITGRNDPDDDAWKVTGIIQEDGRLKVDFSAVGGPGELFGTVKDGNIEWDDGNVWIRAD